MTRLTPPRCTGEIATSPDFLRLATEPDNLGRAKRVREEPYAFLDGLLSTEALVLKHNMEVNQHIVMRNIMLVIWSQTKLLR
ncbi:hypothetical protein SERLADRAFT_459809 [Serpula lacrymans var. lacrymans S7.9]|uniref:Uncharacterized protein n=1 Tax=Serpula lacrymans var. lacrymans (strain S7.9) TaxID=578457 RepID=F8NLJ4_SERL9|nr:uncharacterized protein SERLADRAFT_459809 [Serpula lacrymans var. lacrymans S7.9]EGO28918.1 hypothetical protein SERLADRAFT_459809 [Serpula lacrymans var. lacrymans S7.9]